MNPEIIQALATIIGAIIGAIITGVFTLLVERRRQRFLGPTPVQPPAARPSPTTKNHRMIVLLFAIAGGLLGYFAGINVSKLPFVFGGLEGVLPPETLSQTPTPFPKGNLVMEIGFTDRKDGKCNDYDQTLLGYENGQYYLQPAPNGYIAICHQKNHLESEGSLQVTAFPDRDLQGLYGFAVLFGWSGNGLTTTDACIFGIRRQGTTTRAFFENRVEGKRTAFTQELKTINLDNAPHTLRVVLHGDGNAVGYLDEGYIAEYKFSKCSIGPIGIMAWGPGGTKIYFDDLKLFEMP